MTTYSAGTPLEVPPLEIINSPTNPRKRKGLDIGSLNAMAESIRANGIMQPIVVRPLPGARVADTADLQPRPVYEIIAGERRWRGAVIAELMTMPVLMRDDLDDDQVAEMQLVENIEREDLDPLEEADGFEMLRSRYGYTIAQIAAKIAHGKGESYVYKRITLTKLGAEVRQAMYEEPPLDVSVALLIARYAAEQQGDVLAYLRGMKVNGEWPSFRQAKPALAEAFHLVLAHAVFDIESEDLVAGAGSCTACPKRSGNQGDIFGDQTEPDSCTDTACFQSKREAHALRLRQSLAKQGYKVIDGGDAILAKAGAAKGAILGYQRLDATAYTEQGNDGKEREVTFGDALRGMGKKAPKHRVFIDPHSLEAIPVITSELAEKLVPKDKPAAAAKPARKVSAGPGGRGGQPPVDDRPPEERALDNHHVRRAVVLRMFDAIRHGQRTAEELRLAVKVLILDQDGAGAALEYMGYQGSDSPDGVDAEEAHAHLEAWLDALLPEQLGQLLAMASVEISFGDWDTALPGPKRAALIRSYGIDIAAVQAKVAEDLEQQDGEVEREEEAAEA
jgi:ParB/RepB/Spo0J family partition protein